MPPPTVDHQSFLERVDQSIRRSVVWRSLFRQPYPRDERSRDRQTNAVRVADDENGFHCV